MAAATASGNDTTRGPLNLPLGHAYSMYGLINKTLSDGSNVTLFVLSNPYGEDYQFTGKYKDDNDDGFILLDASEMFAAIVTIHISPLKSNWKYSYYAKENDDFLSSANYTFSLEKS